MAGDDTLTCDGCEQVYPCEEGGSSLDGASFCAPCWTEWQETMRTCSHGWKRSNHDELGEFTRICLACGLVEAVTEVDVASLEWVL